MNPKLVLLFSIPLLASASLQADTIQATLTDSSLSGFPGDTLSFFVTLMNPSAMDTVFLNGIGSTASSAYLDIDTTPFDLNAPFFLDPGESSGEFELFDVTIDPAAPPGPYVGSFVSISGGADGSASDDLADITFDVQVSGSTPEPSGIFLVLAGSLFMFAAARLLRLGLSQ